MLALWQGLAVTESRPARPCYQTYVGSVIDHMSFSHCPYTADNGTVYQVKCETDIAAALGITTEALFAHPKLPSNVKPRYRFASYASGTKRLKIIVDDTTKAIWTDAVGTSFSGYPTPGARATPVALTLGGTVGEKTYSR